MHKYLKLFDNHTRYEEYKASGLELPNVSHCIQEAKIHYNPTTPTMNIISYAATTKLLETTSTTATATGLHVNSFSGNSGQLAMTNHTFENGVGTIEFDDDVTSIGDYAFYSCSGLRSVITPNSVTSIGGGAFQNCSGLTSIVIPSGVTSIGSSAFYNTPWWSTYSADTSNHYGNIIYINDIAYKAINTSVTSCIFKEGTVSIGGSAFIHCSSLTSIEIPNSVTSINGSTFWGCSGLTSVTIPNSVTTIGSYAFNNCYSLTSVTIPNSVTRISNDAFGNCSSLEYITSLAATAPTIERTSFTRIKSNGTLYVPQSSSGYDVWMRTSKDYLGSYNWTKVEQ